MLMSGMWWDMCYDMVLMKIESQTGRRRLAFAQRTPEMSYLKDAVPEAGRIRKIHSNP